MNRRPQLLAILSLIGLIMVIIFFWASNQTYIKVSVQGSQTGQEIIYDITKTEGNKKTTVKSSATGIKHRVSKGDYVISVKQGEAYATAVAKTKGFFISTDVNVVLKSENKRTFVGQNPSSCMFYNGQILFSYECGGDVTKLYEHTPATDELPEQPVAVNPAFSGNLEGIIKTKEGILALVRSPAIVQKVYILSADLKNSMASANLKELTDQDKTYQIAPYKSGFIVYTSGSSNMFYYPSVESAAQKISITKPKNNKLKPISTSVNNNAVMVAYSDFTRDDAGDGEETSKYNYVFAVEKNGQQTQFSFDKATYGNYELCAPDRLCLLNNKQLEVYDISSKKAKLLFKYTDVQAIETVGNNLFVVTGGKVLSVDTSTGRGNASYSLGEYGFCGTEPADHGYILCISGPKSDHNALFVDLNAINTDSIDKKVASLQKLPYIISVSTYKNYIFITPELGQNVYNPATEGYEPDPVRRKNVNESIQSQITSLGIDRNIYHVIQF